MKVIALERHTRKTEEFILPTKSKLDTQGKIREIFASTNYDVIVAKAKDKIYSMELVKDFTKFGGTRVRDPKLIDYTTAKLNYHPLANKL
jgi:hypothetical protein